MIGHILAIIYAKIVEAGCHGHTQNDNSRFEPMTFQPKCLALTNTYVILYI